MSWTRKYSTVIVPTVYSVHAADAPAASKESVTKTIACNSGATGAVDWTQSRTKCRHNI